jgi:hypothetical protein
LLSRQLRQRPGSGVELDLHDCQRSEAACAARWAASDEVSPNDAPRGCQG